MAQPIIIQGEQEGKSFVSQGTPAGFGLGNVGTQLCGAMQMGMMAAQTAAAAMGAKLTMFLTQNTQGMYQEQAQLGENTFQQAIEAATKQALQMYLQAGNEFASGGIALLSGAANARNTNSSDLAKQIDNLKVKSAQLDKLGTLARTPSTPKIMTVGRDLAAQPIIDPKEMVIKGRLDELCAEGSLKPRVITTQEDTQGFKQNSFDPSKGKYYNENPEQTALNKGHAEKGAYYLEGLDESAINEMNPEQKSKFIANLDKQMSELHTQENTLRTHIQSKGQTIGYVSDLAKQASGGGWQTGQAGVSAQAKKDEAASNIANQSVGVANSTVQNLRNSIENSQKNAEQTMQGFGRVWDAMRG